MDSDAAILTIYLFAACLVGALAQRKNRNGLLWGLIGGPFFIWALIILAFMPYLCRRCRTPLTNQEANHWECPRCG